MKERDLVAKIWCPHKKEMSHLLMFGSDCVIHYEDELLMFSGVVDKNGRGIIEGDIVKAKDEMADAEFEGVVEWFGHLGYFALRVIGDPDEGHLRFSDVVRPELEVLGNKFQNQELRGGGE